MPRPRKGNAWQNTAGVWYARLSVKGPKQKRYNFPVPRRKDGQPVDEEYAFAFAVYLNQEYEAGRFNPVQGASGDDKPWHPTVLEYARGFFLKRLYSSADDDKNRVEVHLAHSELGAMNVCDVKPKHMLAFIEWLEQRASNQGGSLAPRTIRNIYSIVRRVLQRAFVDELLLSMPLLPKGSLPAIRDKKPESRDGWIYERDEVELLISSPLVPWDRRVEYCLKFLTGARHGEVAALQWKNYDASAAPLGKLLIYQSMKKETREIKSTKTGTVRKVPVHPVLAQALAEWWATGWIEVYGRAPTPDDFIVPALPRRVIDARKRGPKRLLTAAQVPPCLPGEKFIPRRPWCSLEALRRDLEALGMRTNRRQHDTRSTLITLAQIDGANSEVLHRITHGSVQDILDLYRRLPWESLCREMAKIQIKKLVAEEPQPTLH